jgi:hypothetical protein
VAVVGIFSIGIMAIIASVVRLHVMRMWAISPINSARYGNDLLLWGQVEANSGIISASVPFLRLLLRRGEEGSKHKSRKVLEIQPPKPAKMKSSRDLELDEMTLVHSEKDLEAGNGGGGEDWKPVIAMPAGMKDMKKNDWDSLKPTSPRMLT